MWSSIIIHITCTIKPLIEQFHESLVDDNSKLRKLFFVLFCTVIQWKYSIIALSIATVSFYRIDIDRADVAKISGLQRDILIKSKLYYSLFSESLIQVF